MEKLIKFLTVFPPEQIFDEFYNGWINEKSIFGTLNARVRSTFVILATKKRQLVKKQNIRWYYPPALISIFFNVLRLFGQHLKVILPVLFALPKRRTEASVAAIGYTIPASS